MRYLLVLLCAALLSSCGFVDGIFGSSEEVRYFADRKEYRPEQSLTVTLANEAKNAVGYNICSTTLERRQSGKWQTATEQEARPCPAAIFTLAGGKQEYFSFTLSAQLPPGDYRCKTRLYQLDQHGSVQSSREIVTENFEVKR